MAVCISACSSVCVCRVLFVMHRRFSLAIFHGYVLGGADIQQLVAHAVSKHHISKEVDSGVHRPGLEQSSSSCVATLTVSPCFRFMPSSARGQPTPIQRPAGFRSRRTNNKLLRSFLGFQSSLLASFLRGYLIGLFFRQW